MAEEPKQTALQRWGSQQKPQTRSSKIKFWLVVLALGVGVMALVIWLGEGTQKDRREQEQVLNDHYVEQIEIHVQNTTGRPKVIIIDGEAREDCKATDDGYLECEEEPQPTTE